MRRVWGIFFIFLIFCVWSMECFAQVKEEKEERETRPAEFQKLKKSILDSILEGFSSQAAIYAGYDSNVNLSPTAKGDSFQELLYSLSFSKPFLKKTRFTFNYDIDALNYSEVTNASNFLNHFKFGVHQKMAKFLVGTGYDLTLFSYPWNQNDDFIFQKGFLYVRQDIARCLYHQISFEAGAKSYSREQALADSLTTFQEKDRTDNRQSASYILGYSLTKKLFFKFLGRYSLNDSNARFVDFYDYTSYEFSPGVVYKLAKNVDFSTTFACIQKNYKTRVVTNENYKEQDTTYVANTGIRYRLNENSALSLSYGYRDNHSNESLEKYKESMVSCGMQYTF